MSSPPGHNHGSQRRPPEPAPLWMKVIVTGFVVVVLTLMLAITAAMAIFLYHRLR